MPSSAHATTSLYTLSLHDALPICKWQTSPSQSFPARPSSPTPRCLRIAFEVRGRTDPPCERERQVDRSSCSQPLRRPPQEPSVQPRSEEHTSELQSPYDLVCRLLLTLPPRSTLFPYTTLFRSVNGKLRLRNLFLRGRHHRLHVVFVLLSKFAEERIRLASENDKWIGRAVHSRFAALRKSLPCSRDRKSTRLNSSHRTISYAVFCSRYHLALHSFPTRRSSDL